VRQSNKPRPLRICALSPHAGFLDEIQHLLSAPSFKVMTLRLGSGPALGPEALDLPHAPIFILDATPARLATESLIETIRDRFSHSQVIIVKESLRDERVFPLLRLGAKGVLRYVDARRDLRRAVKVVAGGGIWISRSQLARFMDSVALGARKRLTPRLPGELSRREREVLGALLEGLVNKEIASKLNISERTVKFHVSHLLQKFGAQRRGDLILKHFQAWPAAS
jgi:DNA-binding NarL/FixJ family response regulator